LAGRAGEVSADKEEILDLLEPAPEIFGKATLETQFGEGLLLPHSSKPFGFAAIGTFLFFGAMMAALAATTLLWPGTFLDRAWRLNLTAYQQLAPLGSKIGILFLLLSVALLASGIGWFRCRLWGWRLAVAILATQVLGDLINLARGDWLRGGIGVAIAGALLAYLLRPQIKAAFSM
jgi:hypothetical protein